MARYIPDLQPQDFSFELALTVVEQHAARLGIRCPVLLDDVGAHMVPAAPHSRTRRSPEGSPHHRGRRDYYRPHPCHQQTVPRPAAAYLGPDTSRYSTDWRCIVPSTLARPGSGRCSPRLYGPARLSGKDKHAMSVSSAVLGLITPQSITPTPQPTNPDFRFDGGGSGGGGASGDF